MVAHQLERGALVDAVALHHDSLGALDHGPARERGLELLDLGLDPNSQADTGRTSLHGAAHKGATAVVQALVDRTPFRNAVMKLHNGPDATWDKATYDKLQALK